MNMKKTKEQLLTEIEDLRARLRDSEDTLEAIRSGKVDALVIDGPDGKQIYTLQGADSTYRIIFESISEGVATLDSRGGILFCNKALADMLKTPMEKLIGGSLLDSVVEHERAALAALLKDALTKHRKGEFSLLLSDGAQAPALISTNSFCMEGSDSICAIVADLTEQKRYEEALKTMLDELKRSNKDLEHFAYIASHDLQEPLRSVTTCMQLLERRFKGQIDEGGQKLIDFAVYYSKRMKALIDDLLLYSRVVTKAREPKLVDSERIFKEALRNLTTAIYESGSLVTHDPLPTVVADRTQILQVFQNLLANAIKFRRKDSPRIHVSATPDESKWVFSVQDNGIGIELQFHDRIFDIFQQLEKQRYDGTGIGLAIVKKTIEQNNGEIWFDSAVGVGTTFYFTWPFASEEGASQTPKT